MKPWSYTKRRLVHTLAFETGRTIAYIALAGGLRRPIDWVQDSLFQGIDAEFERQEISRKLAADMLGITLRTYQRQRKSALASQSQSHTTWLLLYTKLRKPATKETIFSWFQGTLTRELNIIVKDMLKSGWIVESSPGLYQSVQRSREWNEQMLEQFAMFASITGNHEYKAQEMGIAPEQFKGALERVAAEELQEFSSENSQEEARYGMLIYIVEHFMRFVREAKNHQMRFLRAPLSTTQREELKRLHEETSSQMEQYIQKIKSLPEHEKKGGEERFGELMFNWVAIWGGHEE